MQSQVDTPDIASSYEDVFRRFLLYLDIVDPCCSPAFVAEEA